MDKEKSVFMNFVLVKVAEKFFENNISFAYKKMKESKLWDFFLTTYETSHSLSIEYLLLDSKNWFIKNGVKI
jgi:hypothetical protein